MGKEKIPGKRNDNCLYFDISTQERDAALRFLLSSILKVRKEEGFPSNHYVYDEDVNVYLAHLLFAVSLPEYHDMASPYLSDESSEILDWVRATDDKTIRYFIFKVNADHLLIHTSIFGDVMMKSKGRFFQRSDRYYQELARLYYDQAGASHKRIYRKTTGVGDVLEKISRYYPFYQDMLKHVRRDYFSFVGGFRDQGFQQFLSEMKDYERKITAQSQTDHFLDLYGAWMKSPRSSNLREAVIKAARELAEIDPEFHFELSDSMDGREGGNDSL